MGVTYTGPMAVYFNRHSEAPRVWCVADLDRKWEIAVVTVRIFGGIVDSHYEPVIQREDHSGPPAAWFACEGDLVVDSFDNASIHAYQTQAVTDG